jgi:hypothetical protein
MFNEKNSSYVNIVPLLLSWQFIHMGFLKSKGLRRAFQMKPSPQNQRWLIIMDTLSSKWMVTYVPPIIDTNLIGHVMGILKYNLICRKYALLHVNDK